MNDHQQAEFFAPGATPWTVRHVPYMRGSDTSRAAAETVERKGAAAEQEAEVLRVAERRDFTDAELWDELKRVWPDIPEASARRARVMLTRRGALRATEFRRPGRFGALMTVWEKTVKDSSCAAENAGAR